MSMQSLLQIGIDHLSAPIRFRERLAACGADLGRTLSELRDEAALEEVAALSTCSRFEVYARVAADQPSRALLRAWFDRKLGPGSRDCVLERRDHDSVRHAFRVAAGLDSWILGESEILGQVKKAYQTALAAGFTGPLLNRVLQSAVAAGKKARAQTGIQDGIHSIGGAAAVLAQRIFGPAKRGSALVFGAGQAAEAVCRHLAAKNFDDVIVANRTRERAADLARRVGGRPAAFEEGLELLSRVEVAVFSTSCSRPVVDKAALRARLQGRGRPVFLIDLGLPRNVAPDCAALSGVFLYDLEDLKGVAAESVARKAPAKQAAETIVESAALECARQLEKAGIRLAEEALS